MQLIDYPPLEPFGQEHLLCLQDYSPDEIKQVLSLAMKLKKLRREGRAYRPLAGKKMAMIFTKPSLRTRVTFEVGCHELGGYPFVLTRDEIGLGERESVPDVARVLSRVCDGIMIRTFSQSDPVGLAQWGSVPVINGLTDDYHPCQALADVMTLYEHTGKLEGAKLAFVGDGNNVAASLLIICSKLGIDITIGCPEGFDPPAYVMDLCATNAGVSGCKYAIERDPKRAVSGADAVYTDVWSSMGQEEQAAEKDRHFLPYQVDARLMAAAKEDAVFLHCLPAHRGQEVTDEVMDAAYSRVFDQAENRLHAQKAVMALLMGEGELP